MAYTATIQTTRVDDNNFGTILVGVDFDDGNDKISKVYSFGNSVTKEDVQTQIQADVDNLNASVTALSSITTDLASLKTGDVQAVETLDIEA